MLRQDRDTGAKARDWALFHANQSVWNAVEALCEDARRSIDVEQYIFSSEGVGRRLLDLLTLRARQGVAVRILVDGLGSRGLPESEGARALIRSGGQIALHGDVRALLRHPVAKAHRLHRKTVIGDGHSLMIGGTCFHDRMSDWRDTMIRLQGAPAPAAATAAEFERVWNIACGKDERLIPRGPASPGRDADWTYAASGPGTQARPDLRRLLLERIASARREVVLTTPYLVLDRALWRALTIARASGARVTLLMPERSDHRLADLAGRPFAYALKRRGVEVRLYTPAMLHAKLAIIDDWTCVGSFNLDLLSAKLNLENGIVSESADLRAALAAQLEVDLAASDRL